MRSSSSARFILFAVLISLSNACGGSQPATPSKPATPTVTAVAVTGSAPAVGSTSQLTATATLSDNTTRQVTTEATWQSSNAVIAKVESNGMLTAVASGEADITATYQSMTGKLHVALLGVVSKLDVEGTAPAVGGTSQFKATATLSDGTTKDVTAEAIWRSSNAGVATVERGEVTGIADGEADISATYQSASGALHVSIDFPTFAAYNLSGTLYLDASPLAGALVEWVSNNQVFGSRQTNYRGEFEIPAGMLATTSRVLIRITVPGYQPVFVIFTGGGPSWPPYLPKIVLAESPSGLRVKR